MNLSVPDILKQRLAVFDIIDTQRLISIESLLRYNRCDNAAGYRIHPGRSRTVVIKGTLLQIVLVESFLLDPVDELLKGQNGVHQAGIARISGFFFFGDAGTDEDDFGARTVFFPEQFGVGDHGRDHRRHLRDQVGIVFFQKHIDGGAAGGDNIIHCPKLQQPLIL